MDAVFVLGEDNNVYKLTAEDDEEVILVSISKESSKILVKNKSFIIARGNSPKFKKKRNKNRTKK